MSRLIIGPFNRVEGDLEVQLEIKEGVVREARVHAPMFRGFELMLVDRDPMDALTIVPRICGICSVSQSMACARALAHASGVAVAANGLRASNLMLACENLADHLTHFYLFFMPDFTRPVYARKDWHAQALQRFAALVGGAGVGPGMHSRAAVAARARWLELMGVLGGKWPHTGAMLPGGTSRALESAERIRLLARVREMRAFLEKTLYGTALEEVAALENLTQLDSWRQRAQGSDMALFLDIAQDTQLDQMGGGGQHFLSYGAYPQPDQEFALAQGVWNAGLQQVQALDPRHITEDACRSWFSGGSTGRPLHPSQGITHAQPDKPGAYTWNKAPRLDGRVVETGALARQLVDGQRLIRDACRTRASSVWTRVLARLVETARILPLMEEWLKTLESHEPYHCQKEIPDETQGVGLTEAARGSLGHWLRVHNGRLAHYQIIAPTSWNFSPRDANGQPGALEAALVGAPLDPVPDGAPGSSVAVQHIVRSFDPCMVCTVH